MVLFLLADPVSARRATYFEGTNRINQSKLTILVLFHEKITGVIISLMTTNVVSSIAAEVLATPLPPCTDYHK